MLSIKISMTLLTMMFSGQHWLAKCIGSASALLTSLGGLGVLLLAIGDSSFFSIPEGNDILIVVLSAGRSWTCMAYFVCLTVIGSVIGCMLLYSVGRKGGNPILRRRFSQTSIERAERLVEKYGVFTVLIPSILPPPTPFKIFVLSAGVFRLNPWAFFTAVVIGRTIRYSIWGILAVLYGDAVKIYIQNNMESVGLVLLVGFALTIAAMLFVFLHRVRTSRSEKAN
jgi:membrane protein DedA with SNARE-associated domain